MVIVEPRVNIEKLRELLAEQAESERLDFKSECDLRNERAELEFAKDVGAMMALGGYLVIGADDHGQPVDWPVDEQAPLFDEATLRQKLETYLPDPVSILTARHELDGHPYVVVYVPPHSRGFTSFKRSGSHARPGRTDRRTVFHEGQVYIRKGTSSIPITDQDWPTVLQRHDQAVREQAREDFAATLVAIERNRAADDISRGPVAGVTWRLDERTFSDVTLELIRRRDFVPLQAAMLAAPADLAHAVSANEKDTLETILDRITTVAATAITYNAPEAFDYALQALAGCYRSGFEGGAHRHSAGVSGPALWLAIASRVEALGALATRFERWDFVRQLADQPPRGKVPHYFRSWLRHASVEASRAGLLGREDRTAGNLISVARTHIHRVPALRPDQADDSDHDADAPHAADSLLTSVCEFDALWCVVAQSNSEVPDRTRDFFTDFAYYDPARSLPTIDRLVTDTTMRRAVLPNVTDRRLAQSLQLILHMADTREAWYDFDPSPAVGTFISANMPTGA